jgi:hypothetical protein
MVSSGVGSFSRSVTLSHVTSVSSPTGCTTMAPFTCTDSELNLNITVASAFSSSCTSSPQGFDYTGYFVTPAHDSTPAVSSGGYPGAAVTVSANCTSLPCTNALIWAVLPDYHSLPDSLSRGLGKLYAYTAMPNPSDLLAEDWVSTDIWCASSFARPTIVNGSAFVPTYAVSTTGQTFTSCPTITTMGIPFPSGILRYHH